MAKSASGDGSVATREGFLRRFGGWKIDALCRKDYPETSLLKQVQGVGPISSLCFVLTLEDPGRFRSSRQVGSYLGLVPRRDQSGASDPELASPRPATRCCARSSCSALTTSWAPSGATRTYAHTGCESQPAARRTLASGPSSRWRESSPCSSIDSGSQGRCTSPCATPAAERCRPRLTESSETAQSDRSQRCRLSWTRAGSWCQYGV